MSIAAVVIEILLAVFLGFLGVGKLIGTKTTRAMLAHIGIGPLLGRFIGVAECLAALGFIAAALSIEPARIAAAVGVCLLMFGAVYYHLRTGDKAKDLAPAIVVLILCVALLGLSAAT